MSKKAVVLGLLVIAVLALGACGGVNATGSSTSITPPPGSAAGSISTPAGTSAPGSEAGSLGSASATPAAGMEAGSVSTPEGTAFPGSEAGSLQTPSPLGTAPFGTPSATPGY